jgi:alpha-mannosidase
MANKTNRIFLIGNAPIDPVWLWHWQDGYHETHATFRAALDRMHEDPDYEGI